MRTLDATTGEILDDDNTEAMGAGEDEASAFDGFRQSFTGEEMGSIRVLRIPSEQMRSGVSRGSIKGTFLFTEAVDKYTYDELLTYVRDTYGTGTYRIIGTKAGARGIAFNRIIEIERPAIAPPLPQAPTNNQPDVMTAIAALGQMFAQQMGRMAEIMAQRPPPSDPLDGMEKMAKVFAMMNTAFGGQPRQLDMVAELAKIKQISDMFQGGDSSGKNTMDVFSDLIQTFGKPIAAAVMAQQSQQPRQRPALPPALPAAPPVPDAPAVNVTENPPVMPDNAFAAQAKQLVTLAGFNASPETVAETIIDSTSDADLDALDDFVRGPDAVNTFMNALTPEDQKHRPWFEKLRGALLAELDAMVEQPTPGVDNGIPPANPTE